MCHYVHVWHTSPVPLYAFILEYFNEAGLYQERRTDLTAHDTAIVFGEVTDGLIVSISSRYIDKDRGEIELTVINEKGRTYRIKMGRIGTIYMITNERGTVLYWW